MRPHQPQKPVLQKVRDRIDAGIKIVEDLETVATISPIGYRHELRALATRIRFCNSPENAWIVKDAPTFDNQDKFDAHGRLWRCQSKLCPDCLARQAKAHRKQLRAALHAQKLPLGERFYFVTFTIPNPGKSLIQTREIVDRTWTLFLKRKMCASLIRGGAKSEEFTVTPQGFHYHLHCIFRARFLMYQEVRRVWTECLEKALDVESGGLDLNTVDGLAIINIKPTSINEGLVQEVCKYITKADSWEKLRPSDLREIACIRRWHRMFELFGSFRLPADPNRTRPEPIVHTRSLKSGGFEPEPYYWRDKIVSISLDAYADLLRDEICDTRRHRLKQLAIRWPENTVVTFDAVIKYALDNNEMI